MPISSHSPFSWSSLCQLYSHVWLFATPWTVAHQTPLSLGFYRQEYWSGLPFPSLGDLPNPRIEPMSLASSALQTDSLQCEPLGKPIPLATINLLLSESICPFWNISYKKSYRMWLFVSGFFYLAYSFQGSSMLWNISPLHSFLIVEIMFHVAHLNLNCLLP